MHTKKTLTCCGNDATRIAEEVNKEQLHNGKLSGTKDIHTDL